MGFAQHQSFYIRSNWIAKGLNVLTDENSDFFSDKEGHLKLGIGKNMFSSLKYWLISTNLAEYSKRNAVKLTKFGKIIKQFDINCLYNDTLSILHFYLCSNNSRAETWHWFFNIFGESIALKEQSVFSELSKWASRSGYSISDKTLHRDLDTMLQFYTAIENQDDPEDVIFSEFSRLHLIEEKADKTGIYIIKKSPSVEDIGLTALMYVLLSYCENHKTHSLTVKDVINSECLWGKIFNMEKQTIIDGLNRLSLQKEDKILFQRTNNLDVIICPQISPDDYLLKRYSGGLV